MRDILGKMKQKEEDLKIAARGDPAASKVEDEASGFAKSLICEGCKHEFLLGELMLMVYEDDDTEIMTSYCCDCLAYELAVETAVPEDFVLASRLKTS